MKSWLIKRIAKAIIIGIIGIVALGFVVMALWNSIVPELFHGPEVSFWQAIGLLVLSHILLRGWGRWHYADGWRHEKWKKKFEEKLAAMTPEEREKFREEWRRRCGYYPEEFKEKKEGIH